MLNRIEFGAIEWVVGDTDFDTLLIHQLLQIFFEDVVQGTVGATPITQAQDRSGGGKSHSPIIQPPIANAVTGKLTGILARSQV